jgi:hypothetical protein
MILLFISSWGFANEIVQESGAWYKLFNNEEYVADFTLIGGASKSVTIYSNKEIMVGFRSNVDPKIFEAYVLQNMQTPVEEDKAPLELTTPIEQDAEGQTSASSYGFGGGTTFEPVNGKIVLLMINHSKETYKLLIYKKISGESQFKRK